VSAHLRWPALTAARRVILLLCAVGMITGAGLLTAGLAQAANIATDPTPGTLTFTDNSTNLPVTSGPGSELLKWNTTDACPAATSASAVVVTIDPDTNTQDSRASISATGAGPYAGTQMDSSVANLWENFTDDSGNTFELAVVCSAGAGGSEQSTFVYYQYTYITYDPSASTFTVSATGTGSGPTSSPTPTPTGTSTGTPTPTPTPTDTSTGTPTPTPTDTPTGTPTPTPTDTPTGTPAPTPTDTPTGTPAPIPTTTSSVLPSGAPQTGAGGAARPGNDHDPLLALGVLLLAASAAAAVLAVRRTRVPAQNGPGPSTPRTR
jgi:hypothetical protein